jgi:hypothetical protein
MNDQERHMTEHNEPGGQPSPHFGPSSGDGSGYPPPPPGYGPPPGYPTPPPGYGPPPGYPPPPPGYGPPPGYPTPPPGYGSGYPPPPGYGSGYPPGAERAWAPGGIPLRPLALGDIYGGAIAAARRNPGATFGLAAILVSITAVLSAALNLVTRAAVHSRTFTFGSPTNSLTPAQAQADLSGFLTVVLPVTLAVLVITLITEAILSGLLAAVIGRGVLGRKVSMAEAWSIGRIGPVIGAVLLLVLIGIGVFVPVGLVALALAVAHAGVAAAAVLILGLITAPVVEILLMVRLSMTVPVVVLEQVGPWTAIKRSWRLTVGSFWRLFGIFLLTWVVVLVCSAVLSIPFGIASAVVGANAVGVTSAAVLAEVITAVGRIVSGSIIWPFGAGVIVLLYMDLRMRREGFDLALRNAAGRELAGDEFGALWRLSEPASWPLSGPPSQWSPPDPWPQAGGPAAP